MARRRPHATLLPDTPPAREQITRDEVTTIMQRACWRKAAFGSLRAANRAVSNHGRVGVLTAYQCPFHTKHAATHWHIGHTPAWPQVVRMALAVRWCRAHQDDLPTPEPDQHHG